MVRAKSVQERKPMRNTGNPLYQDKEWLKKQYFDLDRKIGDIASEMGVTKKTIHYWLRKYGFRKRNENVGNFNNHPTNENNPNWKASKMGYTCLHAWVRRRKPQPNKCEKCGIKKKYLELANISGEYYRNINDYIYLCVRCHKEMDNTLNSFIEGGKNTRFKEGHKFKPTKETRQKISEKLTGRTFSKEHRENLSRALKGRAPWNRGIPRSEETKKKISNSRKKREKIDEREG